MHLVVGFAAALLVYLLALRVGLSTGASVLVALLTGFMAWGSAYLLRLVSNLVGEVKPEKMFELVEWVHRVVAALGLRVRRVSLVYSSRSREGIQLVQLPEARGADARLLESLLLSSASRGEPLAYRLPDDSIALVMAGRIAADLADMIASRRGKPVLTVSTPRELKGLYRLLRTLYQAAAGIERSVAAYMAVKAVGRLVAQGLVSFTDWSLADDALRHIPAEPIWLRFRVKRQLKRETHIQP